MSRCGAGVVIRLGLVHEQERQKPPVTLQQTPRP